MIAPALGGRGVHGTDRVLRLHREFDVMRTLSKTVVAFGLVAFLTVPAMAQQGRGGGRGFGGGGMGGIGMLLSNASVQQELKLDASQIDKAKEVADKAREKFMASRDTLQSLEGEARMKKMQEIGKEVNDEANTAIKTFLSKDQVHRLHQIQHQVQGAQAFADEHVQNRLKLTDAQKSEIHEIVQKSNGEMRELFGKMQDDPEGTRAKITELRKETLAKAESKLTDEQKATWKEMLGSHFDIKFDRPPGGGGGR
jgi:hypothetical protein